jgi:serine/threonine protein kinase/tetratricopeptide (TPR) repeat protein
VAAHRAEALARLPEVGSRFAGFDLLLELGRGAFARVFLAAQADLAHRYVALKVSTRQHGEPQVLARLQHTNVVPVYSVHQEGVFQAVCMPYLGAATLADVFHQLQQIPLDQADGSFLVQAVRERRSQTVTPSIARTTPLRVSPVADSFLVPPRSLPAAPASGRTAALLEMLAHLSHVDAVLWLAARLAEGLAHAHERGILHSDLKPANVLVSDEGQPMLLDFNLAVDTDRRVEGHTAVIGGTMPYMAPEHLHLFAGGTQPVDARSDLYSLGVILCELLTGKHLFAHRHAELPSDLPLVLDERRTPPPVRRWNPAVPSAVESIVRHCLEPAPARRYQSALELLEDLERQRKHLPLRHAPNPSLPERLAKWKRRHPRLTSTTAVAAVALLAMAALAILFVLRVNDLARREEERAGHVARLEAVENWQRFRAEARLAQRDIYARGGDHTELVKGLAICRQALDRYEILQRQDWRERPAVANLPEDARAQLPEQLGDLLLLSARGTILLAPEAAADALRLNLAAEGCYPAGGVPRAVWEQRAGLLALLGRDAEARHYQELAAALPLRTAQEFHWCAADHFVAGRVREALPLLEEAVRLDPQSFRAWLLLARCHDEVGRHADAAACYGTCIALEPGYLWAHFNRGLAYLRLGRHGRACADYDRVLTLEPRLADAFINRALAHQGLAQYLEAAADLTRALECGSGQTRVLFMRARVWDRLGRRARPLARADRAEGLKREPADEKSWIARGLARLPGDPRGALADFDQALRLNPRSVAALQNRAHVLADHMPVCRPGLPLPWCLPHALLGARERLEQTLQAVDALDRALTIAPDYVPARSGRGVLLARLGKRAEALADAREVLQRDTAPRTLYEVACIYALTARQHADDRLEALRLLSAALRQGFGHDLIESDSDLVALRPHPEFRRLVDVARALREVKS